MERWPPERKPEWDVEQLKEGFPFTKIFNFRNINGCINSRMFKVVRSFKTYLESRCETFVGVSPIHSEVLGHSVNDSDIDIMVLYDSSIYGEELYDDYHAERQICQIIFEYIHRVHDKDLPPIDYFYRDINPDLVKDGLSFGNEHRLSESIADICNLVAGKKIGHYRKNLSSLLKNSCIEKPEILAEQAAIKLLDLEKSSLIKLWAKLKLPDEIMEEVMPARVTLWKKRVIKLLEL